jgi:hypothetical protein
MSARSLAGPGIPATASGRLPSDPIHGPADDEFWIKTTMAIDERQVRPLRGRPRKTNGERLEPLCTSLRQEDYAFLCRLAKKSGRTLAALARDIIVSRLPKCPRKPIDCGSALQ